MSKRASQAPELTSVQLVMIDPNPAAAAAAGMLKQ